MDLIKKDEYRWIIKQSGEMRTAGLVFASEKMMEEIKKDNALKQVENVACLPGITGYSMAMPDIHWGYGFPIGGVAAFDLEKGVISPGGIGYDINCGMRLVRTGLSKNDVAGRLDKLLTELFNNVPSGVGGAGKVRLSEKEIKEVLSLGAAWAVKKGFGEKADMENTEDGGRLEASDPENVSKRAIERGRDQLGTLGSGNHFLEIQEVEEIFDEKTAAAFGLTIGQVMVMFHTGSRGLGYQICDDYLKVMSGASLKYGIALTDRQLACAPFRSEEGQRYFGAMCAAANYAWANRQIIFCRIKESFEKVFGNSASALGIEQLYDISHNIGKIETHEVEGVKVRLLVHRKGATRSFGPGRSELSEKYRQTGQPVIVPGTMGTASYLLLGTKGAECETFGSACHGAGRRMSRSGAVKLHTSSEIIREMHELKILLKAKEYRTIAEEAAYAYKDVEQVVEVCHRAGLAKKVLKLKPLAVMKG